MKRSRLSMTLIALPMIAILVTLGTWQVQRLAWKDELIATMDARMDLPPITVDQVLALPLAEQEWRPASAQGTFTPDQAIALYRISVAGKAGYQIFAPLLREGAVPVLVNLGAVAAASPQEALEAYAPDPDQGLTITGIVRFEEMPGAFTNANDPDTGAWYWLDLDALSQTLNTPLLPIMLVADAGSTLTAMTGGQARFEPANNHLQYAGTWYALALVATVIYLLILRRPPNRESSS
ncbi:MAG: hypothetical protein CMM46_06580 [Rhodospirillaceae bacterium]|nr:hypothetical protein [Rhodospirillaceae bacterium]